MDHEKSPLRNTTFGAHFDGGEGLVTGCTGGLQTLHQKKNLQLHSAMDATSPWALGTPQLRAAVISSINHQVQPPRVDACAQQGKEARPRRLVSPSSTAPSHSHTAHSAAQWVRVPPAVTK